MANPSAAYKRLCFLRNTLKERLSRHYGDKEVLSSVVTQLLVLIGMDAPKYDAKVRLVEDDVNKSFVIDVMPKAKKTPKGKGKSKKFDPARRF